MQKRNWFCFGFLATYLVLQSSVFSESLRPVPIDEDFRMSFLPKYTQVYEDKEGRRGIDEVVSESFQKNFQFVDSSPEAFNFSYSKSAFWLQLYFENTTNHTKELVFVFAYPRLSHLDFFSINQGNIERIQSGYTIPFSERTYKSRFFVFPLGLEPNESKMFYFRVESPNAINLPFQIWDKKAYDQHEIDDHVIQSIYYGIVIAMLLFNLFLYFILKDSNYLLYVSIVVVTAFAVAANNGIAFQYFWPNSPIFEQYALNLLLSLILVLFLIFMRRLLSTEILYPKLDRVSIILILVQIFLSFLFLFSFDSIVKVYVFSHTITACWILLIGIIAAFMRQRTAYFFVLAYSVLFIALIVSTLRALGVLPTNSVTLDGPQFGSALEMILLAFALADRYNNLRKEKEAAESLVKQNLEKSNLELEIKVKERTSALNQSLLAIRRDLEVAKKIQESALSFDPIVYQRLNVVSEYLPFSEIGGDFFDIYSVNPSKFRILVADATGHGVQAAMITMATKSLYDNFKNFDLPPSEILAIFNDEYMRNYISLNSLLTAIIIDIDLSKSTIEYASAGHPPAVLFHKSEMILLPKTGRMLGIIKGSSYKTNVHPFQQGDRLFAFTDGIFEEYNLNEEEFGETKLYNLLQQTLVDPLDKSLKKIINSLDRFLVGSSRQDDITILGIELKDTDSFL